jgi:integrase/recombinase XerD
MTILQALEDFRVNYIQVRGLTDSSEQSYRDAVKALVCSRGNVDIKSLTPVDIALWRNDMAKDKAPATVRLYLSKVKNILEYANKKGYTKFDTTEIFLPRLPQALPQYLKHSEIVDLIAAAPILRERLLLSFIFNTCIRSKELSSLNRTDVSDNLVYIRFGKYARSRTVFIDKDTRILLAEYLASRKDESPALFLSTKKVRYSRGGINGVVKRNASRAGIERRVYTHMLRHSGATDLLHNGANMRHIQLILGHAFISTTQIYTHVENQDLQDAFNQHHISVLT